MTIVLVHGNPETAAIWDDLVPHLAPHNVIRLSPPGFGSPVLADFDCSSDAYRDWLADEVNKVEEPVDLVGHDWGGGHVARVAIDYPDLIRSWTTDVLGIFDPAYVWHDMAQVWQSPEAGEKAVAQMISTPPEALAKRYEALGMTGPISKKVAESVNAQMGRAILALYRSAAQPVLRDIGSNLERASVRPGLAIIATEDHYCGGEELARRSARRAGAQASVLQGQGHWWMCQQPKQGAKVIKDFIEGLHR